MLRAITLLSCENLQDLKSLHHLTGVQDVNSASGSNIAGFGYGYDGASVQNGFRDNRTSQTRAYGSEAAQTISYGYNPTSMLQGEGAAQGGASTPALSKSYSFDAMGNRTGMSDAVAHTQITSAYNPLNQLTSTNSFSTASGTSVATGSSSFNYDSDGNMSLVSTKDAGGSVTSQSSYAYDDESRLIGITSPGSSKWQFVYDGASRLRISRSWLWQNGDWVQNSEKRRVYLGMDVIQERDSNNNVIASYSGGLSARSTAEGTVFYGIDGNGSVTSLTDATGAVVGSYTYDVWGNLLNSSGSKANENPYRYSGKEQLAGYYSYGFRFYNSGLGRWINRDPIEEGGGLNIYAMVGNNPVNMVDAYGLVATVVINPGNKITIYLPIEYTGPGATPAMQKIFDRGIQRWWTGKFGKYQVTTKVVHRWFVIGNRWNVVNIPNCSGRHNADIGGWYGEWFTTRWDDPTGNPKLLGWTAAHESGHLMGLPDRYHDNSKHVSVPDKGWNGDIMAGVYGHAWEPDITSIINYNDNTIVR